ncbi:MAG: D-glycero-beta-D-manno-heptose-7-phosphate kinase [Planctomycetes bacterium]|nr:D-glycero-beta-D-manno-heptose-7-phosphate kinase [Planctomycetota bacterium]MCB9912457.1 D-glycero-beta-D-manno-heptose-7-phosphate kinase [Planctomycetota bacterium]
MDTTNVQNLLLEQRLETLGHPRLAIIGDLIMDRYMIGDVTRISPEAPIPVLAVRTNDLRLGGAGNVVANLVAMQAQVEAVGVVGDDGLGRAMREMMETLRVDVAGLVIDPDRPTIEKTRMMSGVQQMLRVDREDSRPIPAAIERAILAAALASVERCDAVVLSDYGKGLLTPVVLQGVIQAARRRGIPVLVDPKGSDFTRYRGATLVTPNRKEAEQALGRSIPTLEALPQAADELIRTAELDLIVITLSADGIYFRSGGQPPREGRIPAVARAVYDVTGAGDTVVSQLALYLALGWDIAEAVAMANHAAGIVVERLGTHSVTRTELMARLAASHPKIGKVLERAELDGVVEDWRRQGKRVVFTNGCFDVLHAGHVNYLRFARERGDRLLVGVNSDASVRRLKGPTRPVNCLDDRLTVLAAMEMVDAVVSFDGDTPKELIEQVSPDVLVKGEDWQDKGVVGREWVESHGGQVVLAPLLAGRSTTNILERAKHGQPAAGGPGDEADAG